MPTTENLSDWEHNKNELNEVSFDQKALPEETILGKQHKNNTANEVKKFLLLTQKKARMEA